MLHRTTRRHLLQVGLVANANETTMEERHREMRARDMRVLRGLQWAVLAPTRLARLCSLLGC